jgi:hypothetical protein
MDILASSMSKSSNPRIRESKDSGKKQERPFYFELREGEAKFFGWRAQVVFEQPYSSQLKKIRVGVFGSRKAGKSNREEGETGRNSFHLQSKIDLGRCWGYRKWNLDLL